MNRGLMRAFNVNNQANAAHLKPLVYTINEAAALVAGSRTTIDRATKAGYLQTVSRGRNRYIKAQSLHDWVETGMPLNKAGGHA